MATARRDNNNWIRCAECGHKLGRAVGVWSDKQAMPALEIKCHSCGTLNYIMVGGLKDDRT
jgi:phage FluMu protein Com